MGYNVRFEGTSNHSTVEERHEVRQALANLVDELKAQGHEMSTSFIDDEPFNFQDPDERAKYDAESAEWKDTVDAARKAAMGTQASVQQKVGSHLADPNDRQDAHAGVPKSQDPHDSNTGTHETKTSHS